MDTSSANKEKSTLKRNSIKESAFIETFIIFRDDFFLIAPLPYARDNKEKKIAIRNCACFKCAACGNKLFGIVADKIFIGLGNYNLCLPHAYKALLSISTLLKQSLDECTQNSL